MATQAKTQGNINSDKKAQSAVEVTAAERAVGAAFIASGIGSLVLGIVVILTEMPSMVSFKNALNFVGPVGPLSGKTTVSVVAFVLSWVILHFVFQKRAVQLTTAAVITVVLLALGILFCFPPFFDLFAH